MQILRLVVFPRSVEKVLCILYTRERIEVFVRCGWLGVAYLLSSSSATHSVDPKVRALTTMRRRFGEMLLLLTEVKFSCPTTPVAGGSFVVVNVEALANHSTRQFPLSATHKLPASSTHSPSGCHLTLLPIKLP